MGNNKKIMNIVLSFILCCFDFGRTKVIKDELKNNEYRIIMLKLLVISFARIYVDARFSIDASYSFISSAGVNAYHSKVACTTRINSLYPGSKEKNEEEWRNSKKLYL
jgi:hypothetical protein